ncbi:MAG TPA: bifunctional 4-hydroxy-2-oxoglutarate aldolase/2-dehydro-3-deoxy-phosphogluconate aldolase [Bryobacteraceae bacterium]|jgi:2-dehydro-3-deoxyphosphogluconate aldolase/(4S)-4-hydroxy-2-oxoglutarate aldolase|nr:bifunctional 4-hydroxy-2-oxoglutarate aldolase/2-dehydro-3-deoxy-phosphogluconate aldolase [Bryobacteraceae bacterium]
MKKSEVRAQIEAIGIIPGVRVSVPDDARFAAEAVQRAGIPIVEITMTVPKAIEVITYLSKKLPDMVVGAGTVLNTETAQRCIDAGAKFLTSPGLITKVVDFAVKKDIVVFPGALTPTEVITAWSAGADFVKIFPCSQVGGPVYLRSLKVPLPQVPLIASGGVNQVSAFNFIVCGATALGIGSELMPHEAVQRRNEQQIQELARRFINMVKDARAQQEELRG